MEPLSPGEIGPDFSIPSECNRSALMLSDLRYLENRIRETYSYVGMPLCLQVRKAAKGERALI